MSVKGRVPDVAILTAQRVRFRWLLTRSIIKEYRRYSRSGWGNPSNKLSGNVDGQLSVYSHALEKGLSHPHPRVPFGEYALGGILAALKNPEQGPDDSRALVACAVAREVIDVHDAQGIELERQASSLERIIETGKLSSPVEDVRPLVGARRSVGEIVPSDLGEAFDQVTATRHSIRTFQSLAVPVDEIRQAISLAIRAPSSCNRQPWKVYLVENREIIRTLLELQGGLRGWGEPACLLTITSDSALYGNPYERHVPFVDGGLFAMTLVYALHTRGLANCMLNAAQPDHVASSVRRILGASFSEVIVCFIAVGYAKDDTVFPKSPRIPVESVLKVVSPRDS